MPGVEGDELGPAFELLTLEVLVAFHPVDLQLAGTTHFLRDREVETHKPGEKVPRYLMDG